MKELFHERITMNQAEIRIGIGRWASGFLNILSGYFPHKIY
jgi:hypothetical protein